MRQLPHHVDVYLSGTEKLERAKYKSGVLNKPVEDLMEVRYSWWTGGYYMAIEEWIQNNPEIYTTTVVESP